MKDEAAVSLGKRGGAKGGPARAAKLSPARRREIARKGAAARWAATRISRDPERDTLVDATCSEGMLPAPEPILQYTTDHDEITVVDLPKWVIYRGTIAKWKLMCCGGIGFRKSLSCNHAGLAAAGLDVPLCDPCSCIAGQRLRCAAPEGAWPLSFGEACRLADRLGLRSSCKLHG